MQLWVLLSDFFLPLLLPLALSSPTPLLLLLLLIQHALLPRCFCDTAHTFAGQTIPKSVYFLRNRVEMTIGKEAKRNKEKQQQELLDICKFITSCHKAAFCHPAVTYFQARALPVVYVCTGMTTTTNSDSISGSCHNIYLTLSYATRKFAWGLICRTTPWFSHSFYPIPRSFSLLCSFRRCLCRSLCCCVGFFFYRRLIGVSPFSFLAVDE